MKEIIARVREKNGVIVESALMIEAGFSDIFDEVIYVRAPLEDRRRRLKEERGYSDEKIDAVLASQQPEEVFLQAATIVIDNPDGTRAEDILDAFCGAS